MSGTGSNPTFSGLNLLSSLASVARLRARGLRLRSCPMTPSPSGQWSASADTWSKQHPPVDNLTSATREAVRRALRQPFPPGVVREAPSVPILRGSTTSLARAPRESSGDSVLARLHRSMIRRDSQGTWLDADHWEPDSFPMFCRACSPSRSGRICYFESLEAWRLHARNCRVLRRRRVHGPPDDFFRFSLPDDPVRGETWYSLECRYISFFLRVGYLVFVLPHSARVVCRQGPVEGLRRAPEVS